MLGAFSGERFGATANGAVRIFAGDSGSDPLETMVPPPSGEGGASLIISVLSWGCLSAVLLTHCSNVRKAMRW